MIKLYLSMIERLRVAHDIQPDCLLAHPPERNLTLTRGS